MIYMEDLIIMEELKQPNEIMPPVLLLHSVEQQQIKVLILQSLFSYEVLL